MTEEDRAKLRVYVAELASALEDSDIGQGCEILVRMSAAFELGEVGALVEGEETEEGSEDGS